MWTTVKAVVAAEVNRDRTSLIKMFSDIDRRLSLLEESVTSFQAQCRENDIELMKKIDSIQKELQTVGHDNTAGNKKMLMTAQKSKAEILETIASVQERESIVAENIGEINHALQKITGELSSLDDVNRENNLELMKKVDSIQEEVQIVRHDNTDGNKKIMKKIDSVQKELQTVAHDNTARNKEIQMTAQKTKTEILETIASVQEHEGFVTENIGEINHALQEMIEELSSLDEANRLIIAKLLLRDLEI